MNEYGGTTGRKQTQHHLSPKGLGWEGSGIHSLTEPAVGCGGRLCRDDQQLERLVLSLPLDPVVTRRRHFDLGTTTTRYGVQPRRRLEKTESAALRSASGWALETAAEPSIKGIRANV